ncbi:MAG: MBL fold metallo-hydrolase [bacterium]|jgi:glyoxylase-like metal-dependent hydrolase (beta-lactamase superfamily II)/rhodanese-related sulfurtransferase
MPHQPQLGNGMEIAPAELAARIEGGAALQVLDVRAPERLAAGKVDVAPPARFVNVRGSQVVEMDDPSAAGLDRSLPVVTVCGRGHDSMRVAMHLCECGFDAVSLSGGMAAWNHVLVAREIAPPDGFDRLLQFDRIAKGSLAYLLISGGEALAIDIPREFGEIEKAAGESGARIIAVADTHVHADYISGAPALAAKLGIPYYLHPADNAYPYDGTPGKLDIAPLSDGFEIKVGNGIVRAIHTPGHTEGSTCFVAGDGAFTGDFMFIASIGRPDLAGKTRDWSEDLLASIDRAKREWPEGLRVLPAHYGSESERNEDRTIWRTFGEIKSGNAHLSVSDPDAFFEWVESRISNPPEAYRQIKGINAGLFKVSEMEADILEGGKNECALG